MPASDFNILLVEDEDGAADRMLQLLERLDTSKFRGKQSSRPKVVVARNQNDADELVDSKSPPAGFDLIVLDLKYPGRDGEIDDGEFEGMKWLPHLRRIQQQSAIAVQTAYPYGDEMNSAVRALSDHRADEFIPKSASWSSTETRLVRAWTRARDRRRSDFLESGYEEFRHSRVFRAIAEDTRDEVYRRSSRFRNVASQLQVLGAAEASESVRTEYDALIDKVVEITELVDDTAERNLSTIDSATLLDGLELFYSSQYGDAVRIDVERPEGKVRTFKRDLLTSLHELVENAVETLDDEVIAGRRTEGRVSLTSRPVFTPRRGVEIRIGDNGPGFPEIVLKHPFKRGFSTRSHKDKPFRGMGLYVAHRFMNRIFGSVTLSNLTPPDEGAEVVLFVPDLGDLIAASDENRNP